MLPGGAGIGQEPQGDPPGVELGIDAARREPAGGRGPDNLIGKALLAQVQQLARQHAPLGPPRFGVAQPLRIAADAGEHASGLDGFVRPAQVVGAAEGHHRVGLQCLGQRIELRQRVGRQAGRRHADLGQPHPVRPDAGGGALRRGPVLVVEQAGSTGTMVRRLDQLRKGLDDPRFGLGAEFALAPGRAHQRRRLGHPVLVDKRLGEQDPPPRRRRRSLAEERPHGRMVGPARDQRLLGAPPHARLHRPVGIVAGEALDALEPDLARVEADRQPFQQGPRRQMGDGARCSIAARHVAAPVELDGSLQHGEIDRRLRRWLRRLHRGRTKACRCDRLRRLQRRQPQRAVLGRHHRAAQRAKGDTGEKGGAEPCCDRSSHGILNVTGDPVRTGSRRSHPGRRTACRTGASKTVGRHG